MPYDRHYASVPQLEVISASDATTRAELIALPAVRHDDPRVAHGEQALRRVVTEAARAERLARLSRARRPI